MMFDSYKKLADEVDKAVVNTSFSAYRPLPLGVAELSHRIDQNRGEEWLKSIILRYHLIQYRALLATGNNCD